MKAYWRAFTHAVGLRRFFVGSLISVLISLYNFLRKWLEQKGFLVLPDLPAWQLGIVFFGVLLLWWLIGRIVELEIEIEPQLEITFEPGSPYVITEPMNTQGHATRLFRVKVENKSVRNLENCLVKLEDIKRLDVEDFANRFTPVGLITQHQLLQKREGGVFNLRGKEHKFVEVAFLNESDEKSEIGLQYENREYPNAIPRGSYELTIKAYGGGKPVERKFKMFVDENDYFCFEPASEQRA
ncbi:MAG: hypothetical protein AB1710_04590 [Pseudomonadota bacterium]